MPVVEAGAVLRALLRVGLRLVDDALGARLLVLWFLVKGGPKLTSTVVAA